jgi:hypothetical protein
MPLVTVEMDYRRLLRGPRSLTLGEEAGADILHPLPLVRLGRVVAVSVVMVGTRRIRQGQRGPLIAVVVVVVRLVAVLVQVALAEAAS